MRATQFLASAMLALGACQVTAVAQVQTIPATSASTSSSTQSANLQIQITTVSAKNAVLPASAERSLNKLNAEAGNPGVLGALMLCGGGPLPPKLLETFFEMGQASQGSLVIIPSASVTADTGDYEPMLLPWQRFPWASVQVLHAHNRDQVESDVDFVKPLQNATAVWISGGDQRRLAERYLGTPVEKELKKVVDRGGIIGGTSAGSAIASRIMISGGRQQPVIANGLDLLPGAIIDQHFSQRKRYERLASAVQQHPDRVGIGIDESTGLVVSQKRARVLGAGSVYVYKHDKTVAEYEPLRFDSGSDFDLPEYSQD